MKYTAEPISAYRLVLAVLKDLVSRRPITDNDQVLDGGERFEGHYAVQTVLYVMELLSAGPQQGGQLVVELGTART